MGKNHIHSVTEPAGFIGLRLCDLETGSDMEYVYMQLFMCWNALDVLLSIVKNKLIGQEPETTS